MERGAFRHDSTHYFDRKAYMLEAPTIKRLTISTLDFRVCAGVWRCSRASIAVSADSLGASPKIAVDVSVDDGDVDGEPLNTEVGGRNVRLGVEEGICSKRSPRMW